MFAILYICSTHYQEFEGIHSVLSSIQPKNGGREESHLESDL